MIPLTAVMAEVLLASVQKARPQAPIEALFFLLALEQNLP